MSRLRSGISFQVLLYLLFFSTISSAQFVPGEGPAWYEDPGKEVPYDTATRSRISDRAIESAGLLEHPIDPVTYLIGPNDVVGVTIWTSRTQDYTLLVTPDAKLLVPTVGEISVRGLTLKEAERRVDQAVSRTYRVDASLALRKMREFKVNVIGAVRARGAIAATPVTRVSEVLDLAGGALQRGDVRNIELIRSTNDTSRVIRVDLLEFYSTGSMHANPTVLDGDVIRVNVLDEEKIVRVYGEVVQPGWFSWNSTDSISTLLRASYGPTVSARFDSVEVVSVKEGGKISSRTWHTWNPTTGDVSDDRSLDIGDRIFIRPIPNRVEPAQVVLDGEVVRPGVYPITPGETRLRDVLFWAHGFTDVASIPDARLIRRRSVGQQDQYMNYVTSIESENRTIEESEYFRTNLLERRTQGLMTVDFNSLMTGKESENLILVDDDSIYVPRRVDFVRVSGKVKSPGNLLYNATYTYADYIIAAGGYGWKAEVGETQVIKGRTGDRVPADDKGEYLIEPGDAIFVPEEKPSNFWEGLATALTIASQALTIIVVIDTISRPSN